MANVIECEFCGQMVTEAAIEDGKYICYDCFMKRREKEAEDEWNVNCYDAAELDD